MELEDKLYSSTEVAKILGVSLRSVYRYLESGDLRADVKTATGRHRFSKQNILDFLYPNEKSNEKPDEKSVAPVSETNDLVLPHEVRAKPKLVEPAVEDLGDHAKIVEEDSGGDQIVKDKSDSPMPETDWLARFRAAREKALKEKEPLQPAPPQPVQPVQPIEPIEPVVAPVVEVKPAEPVEPVDWLTKFKEAREKIVSQQTVAVEPKPVEPVYQTPTPPTPPVQAPATVPVQQAQAPAAVQQTVENISMLIPKEEPQKIEEVSVSPLGPISETREGFFYYTSSLPGLKELAHTLHKSASASLTPYAFTSYAGMSLYKTIKPFSVIHAYIKPDHKSLFEKALQLTPSDKTTAHLCLIVTDDTSIFETAKDMHGLKVVSLVRLKNDLLKSGEEGLAAELDVVQG